MVVLISLIYIYFFVKEVSQVEIKIFLMNKNSWLGWVLNKASIYYYYLNDDVILWVQNEDKREVTTHYFK